jgi:hypothetical protein
LQALEHGQRVVDQQDGLHLRFLRGLDTSMKDCRQAELDVDDFPASVLDEN